MKAQGNKKPYKKIALVLSMCAIIIWGFLGAGTSLAWFTDTSEEIRNIFHIAEFELEVSHRLEDGTYEKIDGKTNIFDDQALYEPGYVQVVYLKIENKGSVAFDFKAAVTVTDYTTATNVYGQHFNLQDHLRFGVTTADTEEDLDKKVDSRDSAIEVATMKLSNYSTEKAALEAGESVYMALIVCMPEEVGNEANYRGDIVPRVELGISVKADQQQ